MADKALKINAKSVASYVLLPGILPRAKTLATSGFGYLAFLFASIYGAVRILPPGHPYLNADNMGKFGLIQAIAAAANQLEFNKKNLDKIVVFFVLLLGLVLLSLQFFLIILGLFSGHAYAGGGGPAFKSMFVTENPQTDVAFLLLDYVFGIPGNGGGSYAFFGSNALMAAGGNPAGPTAFHQGMHALFNFYNLGILLVGVLIFLYFVVVVVIETAQTGVPFGRRFAKLYAPFRLIIAIGLLVPLNYGFNGAQYITLYAAKLGSSFATNGWILFNRNLTQTNPTGAPSASLIAKPRAPSMNEFLYFTSVYHACREMYDIWATDKYGDENTKGLCIAPYVIVAGKPMQFATSPSKNCTNDGETYSYDQAKKDFGKTDMEIVLGEKDPEKHKSYAGGVRPYCGIITVSLNNDNPTFFQNTSARSENSASSASGVRAVEKMYYDTVRTVLQNTDSPLSGLAAFGERAAHSFVVAEHVHDTCHKKDVLGDDQTCSVARWAPGYESFTKELAWYRTINEAQITAAYDTYRNGLKLQVNQELERRGWGGAGIWYNHIADINGTFTSAVYAAPAAKQYPEVMEFVKTTRMAQNKSTALCGIFDPNLGDDMNVQFQSTKDGDIAFALNNAYEYFACEKKGQEQSSTEGSNSGGGGASANGCPSFDQSPLATGGLTRGTTRNVVVDIISVVFGMNGLFDIRTASCIDNASGRPVVHPLAQLASVGRSLVENSIRMMGYAIGSSFGGGIAGILSPSLGAALGSASSMFVSIATMGLTAGFVLYYILPFLPFIYFFFAVGSWVKSVFEAMVGVPLWALAHLHIDGDGLPGRAARAGYFLIFEIFLRPIVIVFGLIGGMAVFAAMAAMLNNIFDIVVLNITGAHPVGNATATANIGTPDAFRRGVIDQFFFTIMYAVLLYMMGTSSFKMIDNIPDKIMRWIGSGVSTFNDSKGDPTQHLTSYASIASQQVTQPILGGITTGAQTVGQFAQGLAAKLKQ